MSLNKQALTNYYNFAIKNKPVEKCAKCGEVMKGWAKTKCSVCNRFFCQSHMKPYIGQNKKCPDCWDRLHALKNIDAIPTAFQQANQYYINNEKNSANELENKIFASIFGPNNLIKFAIDENLDNDTETNALPQMPEQTQQETNPQEGFEIQPETQTEPNDQPKPEEEKIEAESVPEAVGSLVNMLASDIIAEIQANPEFAEMNEDQLIELFMNKIYKLQSG